MPDLDRFRVWMQAVLTRLFIRVFRWSRFEETKEISLLDEPTTVYTFRNDGPPFAQTTLFGTIIWNETRMEQLSSQAQRLVLRHECSHRDRNPFFKGLFFGMIGFFLGGLYVLGIVVDSYLGGASLPALIQPTIAALAMMGAFVVLFRIEETIADYHALLELGEEGFTEAYDEITNVGEWKLHYWLLSKVGYTKPRHTIRLNRLFQRLRTD